MARLLIHVEGPTEKNFVDELLRDYLVGHGYHTVAARLHGNARLCSHRGGGRPWEGVKREIARHLSELAQTCNEVCAICVFNRLL